MAALCPHCGYDLEPDLAIARDGIEFDPRGGISWHGRSIHLTPSCHAILGALLKSAGRMVSMDILAERAGYEGDNPSNIIRVQIHRIRQAMPGAPIRSKTNRGYFWERAR